MIFREKFFFFECVIYILLTRHLFFKYYLRERNIYEDTFFLFSNKSFEMPGFNPLYYKKKHISFDLFLL